MTYQRENIPALTMSFMANALLLRRWKPTLPKDKP